MFQYQLCKKAGMPKGRLWTLMSLVVGQATNNGGDMFQYQLCKNRNCGDFLQ
jgi:hypothetical protein